MRYKFLIGGDVLKQVWLRNSYLKFNMLVTLNAYEHLNLANGKIIHQKIKLNSSAWKLLEKNEFFHSLTSEIEVCIFLHETDVAAKS